MEISIKEMEEIVKKSLATEFENDRLQKENSMLEDIIQDLDRENLLELRFSKKNEEYLKICEMRLQVSLDKIDKLQKKIKRLNKKLKGGK